MERAISPVSTEHHLDACVTDDITSGNLIVHYRIHHDRYHCHLGKPVNAGLAEGVVAVHGHNGLESTLTPV